METRILTSYLPDWASNQILAQANLPSLLDTPAQRVQKMEAKAGGLPQQEYFQSFPDNIPGPEAFAKKVAQEANIKIKQYIAQANAQAEARFEQTYSKGGKTRLSAWA